jgi:hypothetical protein
MKQLNSEAILKLLEENKLALRKFKVKEIGLFGSFLKGRGGEKSDIDFLVSFEETSFDNYMNLKFFLEGVFGRKIDLVLKNALKPALKEVKKEAVYAKAV